MRTILLLISFISPFYLFAQDLKSKFDVALKDLQNDPQLRHGLISFYVIDANSGGKLYALNEQTGMAPASVQKVITSASAFEVLGKDFRFQTIVGYSGKISNGILDGNLVIRPSGDPSLGSWRWSSTSREKILNSILAILKKNNISGITGKLIIDDSSFPPNPVPHGWIWEDIGNYYGAGAWALNWHENQYDIHFSSPIALNVPVKVLYTKPFDLVKQVRNYVQTAAKGSGDNAILFTAPFSNDIFATGTIPLGEDNFKISGAVPRPHELFLKDLDSVLRRSAVRIQNAEIAADQVPFTAVLGSIQSPVLDSLNYWFLQKSINLYGEAFLRKIASEQKQEATGEEGIKLIKGLWKRINIDQNELGMLDGSGLSPGNRITTHSLVQIMQYARSRPWYQSFYRSLPVMNNISMKDGYISGVRSFTGYVRNAAGKEYTFAFIINNFTGSPAAIRTRMYKLLDLLK